MSDTYPVASYIKDPDAVLDYGLDWTLWLGADTINVSGWTVPAGITLDSNVKTTTATTAWLSGGTAGKVYDIVNSIETNNSPVRKEDRTIRITIAER